MQSSTELGYADEGNTTAKKIIQKMKQVQRSMKLTFFPNIDFTLGLSFLIIGTAMGLAVYTWTAVWSGGFYADSWVPLSQFFELFFAWLFVIVVVLALHQRLRMSG